MLDHTRARRPAVRHTGLLGSTPTAPPVGTPLPPVAPAPEVALTEAVLPTEAESPTAPAPVRAMAAGGPAARYGLAGVDLTDDERLVLERLFRQASLVRQVCLGLLGVALLVALVVLMR